MSFPLENRLSLVLSSKDPSFSALLEHLCQDSHFNLITTAGPGITVETIRTNTPRIVLLDLDSLESVEVQRLILKISLVSETVIVLTGADAAPGTASLDQFFYAGAHGALLKPEGKTSLGLVGESGREYLSGLKRVADGCLKGGGS
jgi:DNA-binding response OmpR family regulator